VVTGNQKAAAAAASPPPSEGPPPPGNSRKRKIRFEAAAAATTGPILRPAYESTGRKDTNKAAPLPRKKKFNRALHTDVLPVLISSEKAGGLTTPYQLPTKVRRARVLIRHLDTVSTCCPD
jgi:hypothetical protein